MEFVRSRMKSK